MAQPSILMVFTGGTISMQTVPGRGVVPARSGAEILSLVPGIGPELAVEVAVEDFDRLPGPHWTPGRMLELARFLDERLARGLHAGAVVTHGTDTLEETAYLLDLSLQTELPVVLTGAMRTSDDAGWDGPANLVDAVRCAAAPGCRGAGVLVVLAGAIHAAREVVKMHTEALDAFESPGREPLGRVDRDGARLTRFPERRERIAASRIEPRVALVTAPSGDDGELLRYALERGARGIVLEALGRGNVPPAVRGEVQRAVERGIPVLIASRCRKGETAPVYGYDGGGFTLREAGAVFAGDLPASKARIKLMLLLGAGADPSAIRRAF